MGGRERKREGGISVVWRSTLANERKLNIYSAGSLIWLKQKMDVETGKFSSIKGSNRK